MPHIERQQAPAAEAATEAAYEEVRQSFLGRLRAEHARLLTLAEVLGTAGGFPAAVFEDLERFAHRLRGAAAVFEMHQIREASKMLELAASGALARRASNNDLRLRRSMRVLAGRLSQVDGATG